MYRLGGCAALVPSGGCQRAGMAAGAHLCCTVRIPLGSQPGWW